MNQEHYNSEGATTGQAPWEILPIWLYLVSLTKPHHIHFHTTQKKKKEKKRKD